MLINSLNRKLKSAAGKLKASSCTFYIRDPHWIDEYRLVAMTGVKRDESMYGFTSPESARRLLTEGEAEVYRTVTPPGEAGDKLPLVGGVPANIRQLFVGFSEREGVRSYARLTHYNDAGECEAILFVNFSHIEEIDGELKNRIRSFFGGLVAMLPEIRQEVIKRDARWLGQLARIASPVWSATNLDYSLIDNPDSYFSEVIGAVLKALDITPGTGLGTIYLYNVAEHRLELHGSYGDIQYSEEAQTRLLQNSRGVVTWVALMSQALLIRDLNNSDYKPLHISINDEVKSEIAVPLEVRGELIGAMCLECTEANKFLPHHVRAVWYAANQVAVAYLLHRHVSINRKLLTLCWRATVGEAEARTSLDEVAGLFKEYLNANYCDIWCYNREGDGFDLWGASYDNFFPQHRPKGWTDYVLHASCPIWLGGIRSVSEYSIYHLRDDEWREGPPAPGHPPELNSTPIKQGVQSELAIPIVIRNECVGIAWVKYQRAGLEYPKRELMELALGFAAQASLVLDLILRRDLMKEKKRIDLVGDDITYSIKARWESDKPDVLAAYVISEPYRSKLGGDFFAKKKIDKDTFGILLLDAQGHGVEGSLHMLPLMTAFESSWDSYSAVHVISQLMKAAKKVGVNGSAIYCIISVVDEKRWLCVSSAGHEKLVVCYKEDGVWKYDRVPQRFGTLLNWPLQEPLMDHRHEIPAGTIIVGYTDGVAEGKQEAARLAMFALGHINDREGDPSELAGAIMKWSKEQQPEGLKDDATVFVVHVK
jgi:GAF domain-containing protein